MHRKIGFSTGSIYSWDHSLNKQIEILKKIPETTAIELNYANISDLDENLTNSNIQVLKSLDYVAIHSPFFNKARGNFYYENNEETLLILKKLSVIYNKLSANMIVFHPNVIKNFEVFKYFKDLKFNFSLENMPIKRNISIDYLTDKFNTFPSLGLVLDTAHALSWNLDMIDLLVSRFKSKIKHIHLSDRRFSEFKNKISDHQQLLFCKDMQKFKVLKELDCPIILELSLKDSINDYSNLKKEFSFAKDYFKE
jgi:sugar phosphate isomerase/epimerase